MGKFSDLKDANLSCFEASYKQLYMLEKTQCIPTLHGGIIVSSAPPLVTQKLKFYWTESKECAEYFTQS